MAKAKREGLRMAKLPIDSYLHFGGGSGKCLTLNQMIDILGDIRKTKDWKQALKHVPRRKLHEYRQYDMERKVRRFLNTNNGAVATSQGPQDFSIHARKKFQIK